MRIKKYYKLIRVDYSDSEYLRITNTDTVAGNLNIVVGSSISDANLEYSLDGVNWNTATLTKGETTTIIVPPTENIYLRGVNTKGFSRDWGYDKYIITFNMDVNHTASGNLLSLIDYNNMSTLTTIPSCSFCGMFNGDTKLTDISGLNIGNIATIGSIFVNFCSGCINLIKGIDLTQITSITGSGIKYMYQSCEKLRIVYTPSVSTWNTDYFANWVNGAGSSATGDKIMYTTNTLSTLIPSGTSGYGNYTVTVH